MRTYIVLRHDTAPLDGGDPVVAPVGLVRASTAAVALRMAHKTFQEGCGAHQHLTVRPYSRAPYTMQDAAARLDIAREEGERGGCSSW